MYVDIGAETSRATKIESSVSSVHSGSLKSEPVMMSSSTVTITSSPESVSYSAQVTPDMPTETATMGTRVGAGVGTAVGTGIGTAVGVYKQIELMQLPPLKQSLSTEQAELRPQGGQLSPPQSTSVSPTAVSWAPFVHSAIVGEGVGIVEGDPVVGAGDGAGDGENVSVVTPVTDASDKLRRRAHERRRRVTSATIASVKLPLSTAAASSVFTHKNRLE